MSISPPIPPLRGPYETFIMAFLVIGGISTMTQYGGHPRSIDAILNGNMLTVWSIMLVLGSVLTLLGIAWRGRYITALAIERIGLILHTAACLIYTVALVVNWSQHGGAIVSSSFIFSIAFANCWRIAQISGSIRRILSMSAHLSSLEGE